MRVLFPLSKPYVIHSILQNYLRNQFYQYQPEAFQKRVLRTAGQCCIAESDFYTAAQFFFKIRDFDAILSTPLNGAYLMNKRESYIIDEYSLFTSPGQGKTVCRVVRSD